MTEEEIKSKLDHHLDLIKGLDERLLGLERLINLYNFAQIMNLQNEIANLKFIIGEIKDATNDTGHHS